LFQPQPPLQDVWQFVAAKSLMKNNLRVCYTLYLMWDGKKSSDFRKQLVRKEIMVYNDLNAAKLIEGVFYEKE